MPLCAGEVAAGGCGCRSSGQASGRRRHGPGRQRGARTCGGSGASGAVLHRAGGLRDGCQSLQRGVCERERETDSETNICVNIYFAWDMDVSGDLSVASTNPLLEKKGSELWDASFVFCVLCHAVLCRTFVLGKGRDEGMKKVPTTVCRR